MSYTLEQVAFAKSRMKYMLDAVKVRQTNARERLQNIGDPAQQIMKIGLKARELMLIEELQELDKIAVAIVQTKS